MGVRPKRQYRPDPEMIDREILREQRRVRWGWRGLGPALGAQVVVFLIVLTKTQDRTLTIIAGVGVAILAGVILAAARPWGRR